jgi:5-methylcytosine-specific restriction endonuclease McrA
MLRACICGKPTRCPEHQPPKRNQMLRAQIAAFTRTCPRCGETGTPSNPTTADHRIARSWGGAETASNLRPMCRRCNSSRGGAEGKARLAT